MRAVQRGEILKAAPPAGVLRDKMKLSDYEYFRTDNGVLYLGNVTDVLKEMAPESVHVCCTSPPYWGL